MPRIQGSPAPAAPTRTTSTAATPAKTETTNPSAPAWGATGAKPRAKTNALASIEGTLHTPTSRPLGAATSVPSTIAGVPVAKATTVQFTGLTNGNELMTRSLEVGFGKLSQSQFDSLKAEFGGKSGVRFDANREYTAVDFLPPAMQALVGKDLDTGKPVTIAGTKKLAEELMMGDEVSINSTPNCHGTAWEMMRQYQGAQPHVQLAYGDAQLIEGRYGDEFTTLTSAKPGEKLDLTKLQPGDVVTFNKHDAQYGNMDLLHSAVYVGGGMFFEKPDTESDEYGESPYRLVTLDQATAPIQDFLGAETGIAMTARRPKATLVAPAEAFGAAAEDVAKLEKTLTKRNETIGRPLVSELIMGFGGGVRGMAFNAVLTKRVETDASGRGVIR